MYAILDIESTGGKYNEEGIMEIAIYRFNGHEVVDQFTGLINPERKIQPFVAKLTGINSTLLRSAPKFHQVAERIAEITKGAILVAHNAQFDYRILRTEFGRLGYEYERKTVCTVALSQKLLPEAPSHKLGKLARSLGIHVSDRHRAHGDALATLQLFKLLLTKDTDRSILSQVIRAEAHGELSPNQVALVATLPSEAGVYYLYNGKGELLFLGSAKNLKKEVTQHFTRRSSLARKLQKETKKVTCKKTGSVLIALLKAYQEQQKNRPKYPGNRKKPVFSHSISFSSENIGHRMLRIVPGKGQEQYSIGCKGIAAAQRFLRKISTEFNVCPASLEAGQPCAQTGRKATEKDNALHCTKKVLQAFAKYSIFGKTIVLLDQGREPGEHSFVLVKKGVLQGIGYVEYTAPIYNIALWEAMMTPMEGDANTRCIIETYVRKNQKISILELTSNP